MSKPKIQVIPPLTNEEKVAIYNATHQDSQITIKEVPANIQLYTRKEVQALLKKQIARSANVYMQVPPNPHLSTGLYSDMYWDEVTATRKRLKKVTPIRF